VFAVPRSIARSLEKRLKIDLKAIYYEFPDW
jgi:hypothetical protein